MKANFLQNIIEHKKQDLEILKAQKSLNQLIYEVNNLNNITEKNNAEFLKALSDENNINIIAEIKRFSPSKGALRPDLNPIELAETYQEAGAKAISVLTEKHFFKGHNQDLEQVKQKVKIPILRKDFIIDKYQIWESKLIGANAILLIAAILSLSELIEFSAIAKDLNLDILFEVHDRDELIKCLKAKPQILGINNRNLKTFEVDLNISHSLIQEFKSSDIQVWVSESGINDCEDIINLHKSGFKAFLIGESLLKSQDPASKLINLQKSKN